MNTLTDLLLGVGQPRVSHFPDLCTLLYTYLSTLEYWTKIVYYLFTQTSPVAHTSALTPTYIKSQKLPNWPISKELGLGRMLLPHWKLLLEYLVVIPHHNSYLANKAMLLSRVIIWRWRRFLRPHGNCVSAMETSPPRAVEKVGVSVTNIHERNVCDDSGIAEIVSNMTITLGFSI